MSGAFLKFGLFLPGSLVEQSLENAREVRRSSK